MGEPRSETFDYVIVGAGTAGCVLANRLSEQADVKVCLIEAGPDDTHPFIHIPAAVAAAIGTQALNWRFLTVPQPNLAGRRIPIPRGHVVGGSGSINGMVYFRGQPRDFDDWAAAGNRGWSYREVLPYFLRSESNDAYPGSPYHNTTGPIKVAFIPRPNRLNQAFAAAMGALGYRHNPDFNGPDPEGYGLRQGTIRDGRRDSTAAAYLRPVRRRANLRLLTDALVARILLEQGRASAVEVLRGADTLRIGARAEIIVCGGAIQSPHILQLSGIGDGAVLKRAGVAVQHHLPGVGANLHDHLAVPVLMETRNSESYGISVRALPRGAWAVLEYLLWHRGPFASNVFESNAFVRSRPGLDRPNLQIVFQPARRNRSTFPLPLGHGYAISAVGLYPQSRGHITLRGPDPRTPPDIDPNLLSAAADLETLVDGLEIGRRIVAAASFARYRAHEVQPGTSVQDRQALGEYVRRMASTVHHPVSTCRMGSGAQAVVDSELKVYGIAGLRVVDASIFPSIVGGNSNAGVVMVAEKAADLIRGRPAPRAFEVPETRVPAAATSEA